MKVSQKGVDLIKKHEGLRLSAYKDPVGILTIGYGHTGKMFGSFNLRKDTTLTAKAAEYLLRYDLETFEEAVNEAVNVELTQYQFDALVSFTFNVGAGNLRSSTLLKKVNNCDFDGAALEFSKWIYAKKIRLPGLVKRRAEEAALFVEG